MFNNVSPESIGIESGKVLNFFKKLASRGLLMHSVIMSKGSNIFCEAYWKPFSEKSLHRMYSTTKSYVGIAVCELAAEGKIDLDDKIIKYFPDKLPDTVHPFLEAQTIRHMLKMQTCMTNCNWFGQGVTDRLIHYFNSEPKKYPGTRYDYDSEGSFVLGALVERVTGKTLIEYLRVKCLDKIGFSKEAHCLQAPGGHTWGDSGLLCTSRDQLAFGRLVANGGKWNGEQLLDSKLISKAISKQTETSFYGSYSYNNLGYGYQIWRCYDDAFAFYGMHDQLMIYHPKTDVIFVCTAGNILGVSRAIIIESFYDEIINNISDVVKNETAEYIELKNYCENLELPFVRTEKNSDFESEISGKKFIAESNSMGITEFTLNFNDDGGSFVYSNAQGNKEIKFGKQKNIIQEFPQSGYSKDVGGIKCEGNKYKCAASAGWVEDKKLSIVVQIIDNYIGSLNITIGFNDEYALLDMRKNAEDFLNEYQGFAMAKKQ